MEQRVAVRKPDGLSLGGRRSPTGAAVMQEESELDWDALYADQAPRVYNYFRFRLAGADVEDLTSRTFERHGVTRPLRRDLAGFSTWLFKMRTTSRWTTCRRTKPPAHRCGGRGATAHTGEGVIPGGRLSRLPAGRTGKQTAAAQRRLFQSRRTELSPRVRRRPRTTAQGPDCGPGGYEHLHIAVTLHAEAYPNKVVKSFVGAGYNAPQVSAEPVDRLLGHLCADNSIDFASVTRRMTPAEAAPCNRWGSGMVEVKYSYQAIILVRSKFYGALPLSPRDIYLALAKTVPNPGNPSGHRTQPLHDLEPGESCAAGPIVSGHGAQADLRARGGFRRLLMEAGCNAFASIAALPSATAHEQVCDNVRDDSVYEVLPETPVRFEQQLQMLPAVLAVVPYAASVTRRVGSQPDRRRRAVAAEYPRTAAIPGSRTMYLYVNAKKPGSQADHHARVPVFLKPLDNDFRTGIDMSLRRPERLRISQTPSTHSVLSPYLESKDEDDDVRRRAVPSCVVWMSMSPSRRMLARRRRGHASHRRASHHHPGSSRPDILEAVIRQRAVRPAGSGCISAARRGQNRQAAM